MERFWSRSIDLVCPICNNKWSDNSYEFCYHLIDPVMISFELICTRTWVDPLVAWIVCYVNTVITIWKWSCWIRSYLLLIRQHNNWLRFFFIISVSNWYQTISQLLIMILFVRFCGNKRNRVCVSLWSFDWSWSCLISNGITISNWMICFQIAIGC